MDSSPMFQNVSNLDVVRVSVAEGANNSAADNGGGRGNANTPADVRLQSRVHVVNPVHLRLF